MRCYAAQGPDTDDSVGTTADARGGLRREGVCEEAVAETLRLKNGLWGKLCLGLYSEIHGSYIRFLLRDHGMRDRKT